MSYDFFGNYQLKTQANLSFDPSEKLIKMKSQVPNYLEVKWRLVMLRELYPESKVTTEVVWHDEEKRNCFVRAKIELPPMKIDMTTGAVIVPGAVGIGHKMENFNDFRDYVEKAETGAIGRALYAAGIGLQYSEVDFEYESVSPKDFTGVDAPLASKPARRTKPLSKEEIIAKITTEVSRLGVPAIQELSMNLYGVADSSKLSNDQLLKLAEKAQEIEKIG